MNNNNNNNLQTSTAQKYDVEKQQMLITTEEFLKMKDSLLAVATQIRKAVYAGRPVMISHHNDADGYCAGMLLERAIVSLIIEIHGEVKYLSNYFARNPSRTPFYDVIDATKDISTFLMNKERNNMAAPLIVIADNGSTPQDLAAIRKVKLYGADVVVVDHHDPGALDAQGKSAVCHEVLAHANPHLLGLSKNFSASMLCFQLAFFINGKKRASEFMAALGSVADHCRGETIDALVAKTGKTADYFMDLASFVDYELFFNKFNLPKGSLYTLLEGPDDLREQLVALYRPIFAEEKEQVESSVRHFTAQETIGKLPVRFIDAEKVTYWNDFFTIGKIGGIAHRLFEERGVTVAHSNQIIVLRAQEDCGFDVNALIRQLQEALPHGRVSGGGHNVAGSIKFVAGVRDDVLDGIRRFIGSL